MKKIVLKNDLSNIKDMLYIITNSYCDDPNGGYEISCTHNDTVLKFSNRIDAISALKLLVNAYEIGYVTGHVDGYVHSVPAV